MDRTDWTDCLKKEATCCVSSKVSVCSPGCLRSTSPRLGTVSVKHYWVFNRGKPRIRGGGFFKQAFV